MSKKKEKSAKSDWRNPAIVVAIITFLGIIIVPILNSSLNKLELNNSIALTEESEYERRELAFDAFDEPHGLFSIKFPRTQFFLSSYIITDPYIDYVFRPISEDIEFVINIVFTTYSYPLSFSDSEFTELSQLYINSSDPLSVTGSNDSVYSIELTDRLPHSILTKEIQAIGNNPLDKNTRTIRLFEESKGIVLHLFINIDGEQYLKYENAIQIMLESFTWNPDIVRDANRNSNE